MANYLNPLADNFTPKRFLLGLVLGAGMPALGILAAADPFVLGWMARLSGRAPWLCRLLVLAGAFTVGGAAVGWLFRWKALVWALVLGYLPLRLLDPGAGAELIVVAWMGLVAEGVAALRQKRERLL